ncbi:MAG: hypothetical protein AAGF77_11340 [Bacteroidota bacterium]
MKKLLLVALCSGWALLTFAQSVDTSVANQTNYIFGLLDKNRIPYNMLLDYGYDFVEVPHYDGVLRSNNYIYPAVYRNLYNSLLSMRTRTAVPELVAPTAMDAAWKVERTKEAKRVGLQKGKPTSALAINGLYYKYARIRTNALSRGDIRIRYGRYDDTYRRGQWRNPYSVDEAFAISLPISHISSSQLSLLLTNNTWHTNQSSQIHSFTVNFGDGSGYKTFQMGQPITHTYSSDNTYTITFRLRLKNGQYKYCRNQLVVTGVARQNTITARNPDCEIKKEYITETRPFRGIKGSATLQIAYAGTCNQLTRPLIVVEGLDTGLFQEGQIIGDSDIEKFFTEVNNSQSDALRNLIIRDTNNDFDIVYVNWDNGVDDLRRNAYVLQAVIDRVNEMKSGNAPNIVLGQSMGGVIARYALRDMENRGEDHETSLYISHDAPHLGAHVPPGYLYFARHLLADVITTPVGQIGLPLASGSLPVGDAKDLIDQPAVKQLLINYVDSNFKINNDVHDAWQQELRQMGYPRQTRNVALSNGSHCAQGFGVGSNQRLFKLSAEANTNFLGDLALGVTGLGSLVGIALGDVATTALGFLPGKASLKANFEVKAFPNSGTARIYEGSIRYYKKLLWLADIRRTITERNASSQNGDLRFDDIPGGQNPSLGTIGGDPEFESNLLGNYGYNIEVVPQVGFIPTASALDVGGGGVTLNTSDYRRSYAVGNRPTGSRAIPFQNFTSSFNNANTNEIHLSFNQRNGNWLADELRNDHTNFDCTFVCGAPEIVGSSYLCTEDTYSVDLAGDATILWSSSDLNVARPVNSRSAITRFRTPANSYRRSVTLRATISSSQCGNTRVLTKTVWVGRPASPSSLSGPTVVNTGALVTYNGGAAQGATSYEWRLPYPFKRVSQFDYFGNDWQIRRNTNYRLGAQMFTGYGKRSGLVQLMGVNRCGRGGARTLSVRHRSSGGGGGGGTGGGGGDPGGIMGVTMDNGENSLQTLEQAVLLYPNTATDYVTVEIVHLGTLADAPSRIQSVTIYPQLQNVISKTQNFGPSGTSKAILDVTGLQTGVYTVSVVTDQGIARKTLLIKSFVF